MEVKSFLDEGFDFIEESCSTQPLEYTEVDENVIIESNDVKSPYHILGRCRGVFQPINEPSRNFRVYESNHWSLQLNKPEVQERLRTRSMWGTLGHFDRKISDVDIREGLVSHIITKLEIHEDEKGKPFLYGELEILDTPAGKILEAMYKGGANLYVSSRGAGKLVSVMGDTMKHVDPNSFYFEGFDIVRAPGFLKARPVYESAVSKEEKLQESIVQPTLAVSSAVPTATTSIPTATVAVSSSSSPIAVAEASQVAELKSQVEKLAKIVEKVVDDVYEEETSKEAPANEDKKEALVEAVTRIAAMHLPEDSFELVLDMLKKGIN